MFAEFKEFIDKGNAIDLAVGVVIGAAFGKIVDSLVNDLIMPIVGLITGGVDFSQRFLVLSVNDVPNTNLVWKDTVLLPAGSTADVLLDLSNPGRWMVHCHIAEHLSAHMMMSFTVR